VSKTLADTVQERLDEIKSALGRRAAGEVVTPFISTGIKSWDRNGGILKGILTVIGAATGEGKSIVKLQLARGAAQDLHNVCMVDFEDPAGKTADRAFSGITGINNRLLGLLDIEEFDLARLEVAAAEMATWAARVEHHCGLKGTADVLRIMEETTADLILIDYAQAFPEDDDRNMERTIAKFAWEANEIAQRKNCAVVVFSQIIREVEQRGYRIFERAKFKDPDAIDVSGFCPGGLSDISWAKSLGERAKELGYIWRENRIAKKLGANVADNRMRIVWGKVNFGEEKDIVLEFDGPTATIRDLPKNR
jgi:replicative DNA helicase